MGYKAIFDSKVSYIPASCGKRTPFSSITARLTHLEGYGLPREGFDENLHPGVQPTYENNTQELHLQLLLIFVLKKLYFLE